MSSPSAFTHSFHSFSRSSSIPRPSTALAATTSAFSRNVPRTSFWISSQSPAFHSRSAFVITTIPVRIPRRERISRCSRVCGITPASAAVTSMAMSIPPAPASIFFINLSCPGTSIIPALVPSGRSRKANPFSIVIPRFFSSARRSVSLPVSAFTRQVLP